MSEKIYNSNGTEIILNVQYSKIGNGYPRIFIKQKDGICVNMDVTIGACFKMDQEDFQDWKKDAEIRTKEEFRQDFVENGLKLSEPKFDEWLKYVEGGN